MYTRFIPKPLWFAASCLLMATLVASSDLKGSPLNALPDVFITGAAGHELYSQVVLSLPDTGDFYWSESTPGTIGSDSQGQLQSAIFFTLLMGGMFRYLISERVRRYFQDIFDPLNWHLYQ